MRYFFRCIVADKQHIGLYIRKFSPDHSLQLNSPDIDPRLMKILCWNVNGLRSALKKDFAQQMCDINPDIICLQEIKAQQSQMRAPVLDGYLEYWNSSIVKKGYSGTMMLSKHKALAVKNGMPGQQTEGEGRVMVAEYDNFNLVNVYAPNSQDKLKRLPIRLEWDAKLRATLLSLDESKPVILCGDLNVAHKEIDLAHPARNRGKRGFSDQERDSFTELLNLGFIDAFRHFESGPNHYSFWRFNKGTREKNLGWRIDYFCVSETLERSLQSCYLLPEITGSDHCPVVLELSESDQSNH